MKKLLFFIPYILVSVIFLFLLSRYVTTNIYISKYNEEKYNKDLVKYLFFLNANEKEIAYFNYGTYSFKTKNYFKAAENFEKALKVNKKKDRDCSIRINASLSYLEAPDENTSCEDWKYLLEQAEKVLKDEKSMCYEDGNPVVSKAVDVEEYMAEKALIFQQLCTPPSQGGGGGGSDEDEGGQGDDEGEEEQDPKEKEIEERNKDAQGNRNDELDKYKDYDDRKNNGGGSYKNKKTW